MGTLLSYTPPPLPSLGPHFCKAGVAACEPHRSHTRPPPSPLGRTFAKQVLLRVNRIGGRSEVGKEAGVTIADCKQLRAGGPLDQVVIDRYRLGYGDSKGLVPDAAIFAPPTASATSAAPAAAAAVQPGDAGAAAAAGAGAGGGGGGHGAVAGSPGDDKLLAWQKEETWYKVQQLDAASKQALEKEVGDLNKAQDEQFEAAMALAGSLRDQAQAGVHAVLQQKAEAQRAEAAAQQAALPQQQIMGGELEDDLLMEGEGAAPLAR